MESIFPRLSSLLGPTSVILFPYIDFCRACLHLLKSRTLSIVSLPFGLTSCTVNPRVCLPKLKNQFEYRRRNLGKYFSELIRNKLLKNNHQKGERSSACFIYLQKESVVGLVAQERSSKDFLKEAGLLAFLIFS